MVIYNITFIVDPSGVDTFKAWLKRACAAPVFADASLLRVAQTPDAPDFGEQAASFSLQTRFKTMADAIAFAEGHAEELREAYARMTGGEGLTFATILEELPLA